MGIIGSLHPCHIRLTYNLVIHNGFRIIFTNDNPTLLLNCEGGVPRLINVLGRHLAQRGQPGDPPFNRLTGEGYVAPVSAPYDRARREGAEVVPLRFETFLGGGPETVALLRAAVEARGNKLRGSEYDATTWSARTWMGFTAQRVSCALARAVAWELASAMELTRVRDARDDD